MYRPRSKWEWFQILIMAVAVFIAVSLPVFVIRTIDSNTRVIVEQMVRINSLTIVCISQVEPPVSSFTLQACINQGLTVIDPNG